MASPFVAPIFDLQNTRAGLALEDAPPLALPGAFYGAQFHALEREKLFPASWCAVATASSIPEPGDMLPIDLAGASILLVRNGAGEVEAFHNICRHRGIKLVGAPCTAPRITCPWHAWTYGLDGRLLATPEFGGEKINQVEGFARQDHGLKPIALGRWLDLVFVNIDGSAPPFAEWIAPVETLFAHCDLSDLIIGERLEDIYAANWKIAMEAGIEDYHLPFGHPQLEAHLFRNVEPCVHLPVYTGGKVDVSAAHDQDSGTRAWTARLPDLLTKEGKPLPELYSLCLFPTAVLLVTSDHVMLGTLLPDGPDRTRMDISLYYQGSAASDPALAGARQGNLEMWQGVIPQDKPFMEAAQATLKARDEAGIAPILSPYWEGGVRGFQQMVLDAVA
ncbi:aromatic ring-hydroxylating dioxygenase subunit alpha [Novosphingobium profundi]|uniref:aromatic ring-hydroxylating oxygenase subunit alpha n=1 Tax=Novosphingobium profundi TaxID=1774954 RepID=UPI001BDA0356|nr:aromatic ring-hydroxylating dioxygenase subunit alpha [Novosphingobium profundi]